MTIDEFKKNIAPHMDKGYVAMDKMGGWNWFDKKPEKSSLFYNNYNPDKTGCHCTHIHSALLLPENICCTVNHHFCSKNSCAGILYFFLFHQSVYGAN